MPRKMYGDVRGRVGGEGRKNEPFLPVEPFGCDETVGGCGLRFFESKHLQKQIAEPQKK